MHLLLFLRCFIDLGYSCKPFQHPIFWSYSRKNNEWIMTNYLIKFYIAKFVIRKK